jgi:Flp pilus assembly protein TadG
MIKRFMRSERGTSLIEFAIIAPVLLLLVMGVIEVGRYMYFGIVAAHAAESGVKYGAQNLNTAQDAGGMEAAALLDGQNLPQWTITAKYLCSVNGAASTTCSTGEPPAGTIYYVQVKVAGTFTPLMHYPGIPSSVPVSHTTLMRVQSQ